MFKKIYVILFCVLFLFGCVSEDSKMPYQEYLNSYSLKSLLILSKASGFKAALLERIGLRLRSNYSITIDDLDKIDKYNFAAYTRVLIVESIHGGKYEKTEAYLSTYGGVNNMVFLGTVGGWETTPNLKIDAITAASTSENIKPKANILISKIRNF